MIVGTVIGLVVFIAICTMIHNHASGDTATSYCTKHVITHGWGPDRLVWQHGVHRTSGNKCDGAKHRRTSKFW
jgi:hypothetical protein